MRRRSQVVAEVDLSAAARRWVQRQHEVGYERWIGELLPWCADRAVDPLELLREMAASKLDRYAELEAALSTPDEPFDPSTV